MSNESDFLQMQFPSKGGSDIHKPTPEQEHEEMLHTLKLNSGEQQPGEVVELLKDWREGKYPDLSHFSAQEKADLISGCVQIAAKEIMMWFYSFGLKTHIECEVVNDPTNERFKFSFVKLPSQPPAGEQQPGEWKEAILAKRDIMKRGTEDEFYNDILSAMDEYSASLKKENEELRQINDSVIKDRNSYRESFETNKKQFMELAAHAKDLEIENEELKAKGVYDLEKLFDWIMDGNRKNAQTHFTAGIARNIASMVEFKLHELQSSAEAKERAIKHLGKRCEAAEDLIAITDIYLRSEKYLKWEQLKNQKEQ